MQLLVLVLGAVALLAAIVVMLGIGRDRPPAQARAGLIVPERSLTPPEQQTPGTVGPLNDGQVEQADLRITLVDLAARGFLSITALTDDRGRAYDWVIKRTDKLTGPQIHRFEELLLTTPFTGDRSTTTLSALTTMATRPLQSAQTALTDHLRRQGWFEPETKQRHSPWGWVGALVLLLGLLLTVFELIEWLASNDFRGIIGGAMMLAAGVLFASRGRLRSAQTDAGQAARAEMTDYQQTLAELSAEQLPPAEIADLFNRLLPWALAFGDHARLATNVDAVLRRAGGWGRETSLQLAWFTTDQPNDQPTAAEFSDRVAAFIGNSGARSNGSTGRQSYVA